MDYTDGDLIELIQRFLHDRWSDQFGDFATTYPDTTSLYVDYWQISSYSPMIEDVIDNNPTQFLKCSEIAVREHILYTDLNLRGVVLRVTGYPFKTAIRDIRHKHIMKTVCVEGVVRRVTDVRPKFLNIAFRCLRCDNISYIPQMLKKIVEPYECENETCGKKGPFVISYPDSEFTDFQILEIQESFDSLSGTQPRNLVVNVYDDLVDKVTAGDKIQVSGMIGISQKISKEGKATVSDIVLESNYIEKLDKSYDEIEISEEEEAEIIEMSQNPNIKQMITQSIAPSIFGYDDIKEAVALQLFSGVSKVLPDGVRIRGDIHVMLVGDPGTAKSQIIRYVTTLSPRGVFNSGKSASGVGLTAAVVKDTLADDRWVLEGGALVLADNGLCAVDEMDKMREDDVSSLHEAMEQQTITISKAGIHATLQSRCALLAAANPVHGRFNEYDEDIAGQINMSPTLLSRFDLIFMILDKPNHKFDAEIASHISKNHIIGGHLKNDIELPDGCSKVETPISNEMLRKYITYSRTNYNPIITPEARERIERFYVEVRSMNYNSDTIPITARKIDGMYRLAEASCKMRLGKQVSITDADDAICIISTCLKNMGAESEGLNCDVVEIGESLSQRNNTNAIIKIIKQSGEVSYNELLKEIDVTSDKMSVYIKKLKRSGRILPIGEGMYRFIQ